jgi:hypothetical protein
MPDRVTVHILPEHFEAFQKLMPSEQRLGRTYGGWVDERAKAMPASGEATKFVTIRPEEFEMYCLQLGQVPNYSVLEAFATLKARES